MKKQLTRWSALVSAGLILMTGCGGSGSPTGPRNKLSGTYCWSAWSGDFDGPQATAQWGTVRADGLSLLEPEAIFQNQGGVVSGPLFPNAAMYSLSEGSRLTIEVGSHTHQGGLSDKGDVAVAAAISETSEPGILVLGHTGSGFGLGSVTGEYHISAFWLNSATSDTAWFDGTASFDGAGTCDGLTVTYNTDGGINIEAPAPSFGTYTVDPAGNMTWVPPFDVGPFEGGVFAGGELIVLTAASDDNNHQGILVLIKKGVGLSNATFDGSYHTVALLSGGNPPPRYACISTTTVVDGAGSWMREPGIINVDGEVSPFPDSIGVPYEVTGNGRLDMNNGFLRGGVSPSGRFAVVGGGTTPGSEPQMWIFVR